MAKQLDADFMAARLDNARAMCNDVLAQACNESDPHNLAQHSRRYATLAGIRDTYAALLTECRLRDAMGDNARSDSQWTARQHAADCMCAGTDCATKVVFVSNVEVGA